MAARHFKPKACAWCGTEFTPTAPRGAYCTPECRNASRSNYRRDYREANKDQIRDRMHAYRQANKKRLSEQNRNYREANKERIREQQREHREANATRIRQRKRKYYEANKARIIDLQRKYYEANSSHIRHQHREYREANPDKCRQLRSRWRANNPDKVGAAEARRAQAELEGNATTESIRAKWEAGNHSCILCGQPIDDTLPPNHPMSRTLEHLTPIVRGGSHDIDNLDFAHFRCNSQKGAKTLEEYREWQKRTR